MIRALVNGSVLLNKSSNNNNSFHFALRTTAAAASAAAITQQQTRCMTMRERSAKEYRERKEKEARKVHTLFPQQKRKVNNTFLKQVLTSYKAPRRSKPAYQMFQNLVQHRVLPDRENFRRFLYVVGYRGGELKNAFNILRYCGRVMKDVGAYNIVIHSLVHFDFKMNDDVEDYLPTSSFKKAFELYDEMKALKLRPDLFTFHYLFKNCAAELQRIQKRAEKPDEYPLDEEKQVYFTSEQVLERAQFVADEMMQLDVTLIRNPKLQSILPQVNINATELETKYAELIEQEKRYDEEYKLWKKQKELQRMIQHEKIEREEGEKQLKQIEEQLQQFQMM